LFPPRKNDRARRGRGEQVRVVCVIGTRPEAIKMRPVVRALRARRQIQVEVWATGQHRELLDHEILTEEIRPAVDLDIMLPDQMPGQVLSAVLQRLGPELERKKPDLVLVQGDTTSVLAAALASHYSAIPVGHVEAGLRTFDLADPFPEEMNRQVTSRIASLHFAPTERARANLLREGVPEEAIFVTGNPGIDALDGALKRVSVSDPRFPICDFSPLESDSGNPRLVVATVHRRENRGERLEAICRALAELPPVHSNTAVVVPVHPAPEVSRTIRSILGGRPGIRLLEPLGHDEFVRLLLESSLVLTDSGGVLEEAVTLGKPTLILRYKTERPEAIETGLAQLVGADPQTIFAGATAALDSTRSNHEPRTTNHESPFGSGHAAELIADAVGIWYGRRKGGGK